LTGHLISHINNFQTHQNGNDVKISTIIAELSKPKSIRCFHGTTPKKAATIKTSGLKSTNGYNPGWYMVSTDLESALYHAQPDDEGGSVAVIEFNIPLEDNARWVGYPYLWRGYERNSKSTWYALKEEIPAKFIKKIHKFSNAEWIQQKNEKY